MTELSSNDFQGLLLRQHLCRNLRGNGFVRVFRGGVCCQQRLDFAAQFCIPAASMVEEGGALLWLAR
ncbi:MAG: hypothetical protein ACKV2V_03490 [Blastocatellia bacterium]